MYRDRLPVPLPKWIARGAVSKGPLFIHQLIEILAIARHFFLNCRATLVLNYIDSPLQAGDVLPKAMFSSATDSNILFFAELYNQPKKTIRLFQCVLPDGGAAIRLGERSRFL